VLERASLYIPLQRDFSRGDPKVVMDRKGTSVSLLDKASAISIILNTAVEICIHAQLPNPG